MSWRRDFHRAAKNEDILKLLTGEEVVVDKPVIANFMNDPHISTIRVGKVPPNLELAHLQFLFYKEARKDYNDQQKKIRVANNLIREWVSDIIKVDLDDFDSPVAAYKHLTTKYRVDDKRAVGQLLAKVAELKLDTHTSMQEYLASHKQSAQDLKILRQPYSNTQLVNNILLGLSSQYDDFKELHRLYRKREGTPNVDDFFEKLLKWEDDLRLSDRMGGVQAI